MKTENKEIIQAQELTKKAREILKALDYTVTYDYQINSDNSYKDHVWIQAVNLCGYELNVEALRYKSKNHFVFTSSSITSKYGEQCYPYNETHPEVNISFNKSVEQIVKELHRRFIPDHETYSKKCLEMVESSNKYYEGIINTYKLLTGKEPKQFDKNSNRKLYANDLGLKNNFSLRISSNDCIHIDHYFTAKQAVEILKILKKYPEEEK